METDTHETECAAHGQKVCYAGAWRRLAAFTLDYCVVIALLLAGGWCFSLDMGGVWVLPVGLALFWLYSAGLESSSLQATLGKFAVGLRVTGEEGGRISFARAAARSLCKFFPAILFVLAVLADNKVDFFVTNIVFNLVVVLTFIAFFFVLCDPQKRGLHDIAVQTRVAHPHVFTWWRYGVHVFFSGLGVALFVFGLISPTLYDGGKRVLRANLTAVGVRGKDIHVAICNLRAEAEAQGKPRGEFFSPGEQGKRHATSTAYFNDLLAAEVQGIDMTKFAGAGVRASMTNMLTAENNIWAILINVKEDDPDTLPLMITRNVDIDALNRALKKGITKDDFRTRVDLGTVHKAPFAQKGFVMIRKSGGIASASKKKHYTLGVIFNKTEIPPRPEGEPPLMYVGP
ncbi:MAG: RDD family protein [Kiritimatiellaeota bacterium]|nr:RDD family protein [Kiritimatiellota bacterium]